MHVSDGLRVGNRVRKAKVVFDPSEDQQQTTKKRLSHALSDGTETKSKSPMTASKLDKIMKVLPSIKKRRATEGVILDNANQEGCRTFDEYENGCIVCTRADVRKGRFVYCTDCSSRGHFTCLRNRKLISSSDEEPTWQCGNCQACNVCYESAVHTYERLYKCYSCSNSYHLYCQKRPPTSHIKKKKHFKCENCDELERLQNDSQPDKTNGTSRKSDDGFAGFSQEDTNGVNSAAATTTATPTEHSSMNSSYNGSDAEQENDSNVDSSNAMDTMELTPQIKTPPDSPESAQGDITDPFDYGQSKFSIDSDDMDMKAHDNFDIPASSTNGFKVKAEDIDTTRKNFINTTENVPDVRDWDCDEIFTYFMATSTAEYAHLFKEREIDGDALLLINRDDVLTKFNLKLGPALRLYSHILMLQFKNNNPLLAWDED